MCGLIGFFVGCDLNVVCPKRKILAGSKQYNSSFKNWDSRSSVRNGPRRVNEVQSALFPESFIPVLDHGFVKALNPNSREFLQKAALYRFLNFTHKLEMLVVNTVTANIALGRYNADFTDDLRLDAHRIYVDEGYHALFSFELMHKIRATNGTKAFQESTPAFIRRTRGIVESHANDDRALLELLTVIISEMLITSALREAASVPNIDAGVSSMISDHAGDEARHHAFYRHVLFELWPHLSDRNRELVIRNVQPLLMAYVAPDVQAIETELLEAGLTRDQSAQVIAEKYSHSSVSDYAKSCGGKILATFEEILNPQDFELLAEQFSIQKRPEMGALV